MKNIISIFLLLKSLLKRVFTNLDIAVANALMVNMLIKEESVPAWLVMIANLEEPNILLPEAWADFMFELKADLFGGA